MSNDERHFSIGSVERETGLSKDLLRAWEKRYGFPAPERDAQGDRIYPAPQVEKLRLLRRLIDDGHRPGRVVGLPLAELLSLRGDTAPPPAAPAADDGHDLMHYIALLSGHQADALRAALQGHLTRLGLERFVIEIAAPLCTLVGDAWTRNAIQLYEEHLFTEELVRLLRGALQTLAGPAGLAHGQRRPRVLLTTVAGEPHAIGLLMAETLLALHGCDCLSLGPQTPEADVGRAAAARAADVVALSYSAWFNVHQVGETLGRLRALLPDSCEIWVGGANAGLRRPLPAGVVALADLRDIAPVLARWRQHHDG